MWKVAGIEMLMSTGISLGFVLGLAGLGLPGLPISSETLPALWIGDVDLKTLSLRRKLGRAGVMPSALLTLRSTSLTASNHLNPRGIRCRLGSRLGLGLDAVLRSAARVLCGRGLGRWSWFWIRGFSTSLPLQNFA